MRPLTVALFVVVVAMPVGAKQRALRHPGPEATPTFSREVARILQDRCQTCHREGDIAPFPLMTYADAKPRAALIRFMTESRQMPPWMPADGCGTFEGERRLSDGEISTIRKWVEAGAPEGNRADLPQPRTFSSNWALGEPDLILSSAESYTPHPGTDTYRCFSIPTNLTSDRWVRAVDTRPGDRTTVHHVITYLDPNGASLAKDEAEPGPGYTCFGGPGFTSTGSLGGWGPGFRPLELPEGVALPLPAGARVVMQVHYHPHGGETSPDRTEFGVYFSSDPAPKEMRFLPIANTTFTIPPNDANYRVDAAFPIPTPFPMKLWIVAPHMHLLGKDMTVEMTPRDGSPRCLIRIEDWNFRWQGAYRYVTPVDIPAGAKLSLTAHFDNSADNPDNPNVPPKPVSWGEATTDEMCLAFLGVTIE